MKLSTCVPCAELLQQHGGKILQGQVITMGVGCEFHDGPSGQASRVVEIDESALPDRRPLVEEPEPEPEIEKGLVTNVAARLLAVWSSPHQEPSDVMLDRAASVAKKLVDRTKGA